MQERAYGFFGVFGIIGGIVSTAFGGWDTTLTTLIIFMGIDYITGLMVAGIFGKSSKSDNGGLQSKAGFKGLCRKGVMLLIVLVACRLDLTLGSDFVRSAVVWAFVANETISIIENAGIMGVPIPKVITKAIDLLKTKAEEESDEGTEKE